MPENNKMLQIIKNVTIFSGLPDSLLNLLLDKCKIVKYALGEMIIEEGTHATDIFVILKGKAKIIIKQGESEFEITTLHTGQCIGEAAVIGVQTHSASVIASEDTSLLALSKDILIDLQKNYNEMFSLLILNIAREMARRLRDTDHILLHYTGHKKSSDGK